MSQIKKEQVRGAILDAAFQLFRDQGYNETSIPAIARAAGISTANVYVYFTSKMEILFTLYGPWLQERLDRLDRSLRRIRSSRQRMERLLLALWRDLPRDDNGFTNNLVQALSASATDDYNPQLREMFQGRVAGWVTESLGVPRREGEVLAGVLLMAFDGFAINVRLAHGMACNSEMARLFAGLLSAPDGDEADPAD
ncbi:MAG: TetR/AcrR family transcriptional regulator [Cupriavidus necator]